MADYTAPAADIQFVLTRLLKVGSLSDIAGFEALDDDLVTSMVEHFSDFAAKEIAPLNEVGDRIGAHVGPEGVETPPGFKEAYQHYVVGEWPALSCRVEDGGHGMPGVVRTVVEEILAGANLAFAMAPMTASGTYEVVKHSAPEDIKSKYLPKVVSGEWLTAMSLTEPQAGSALGLLSTRAEPQEDGSYRITGTKIFNSWGDHDLTENVVHLVLARLTGAPSGTRGISVFLVPKYIVGDDGALIERNSFSVGSVEKKMGIHASPTCVTNFDGATGYLVGAENRGMASMFIIMNSMRLATGVCAVGVADAAYRNALAYTHNRLAGRSTAGAQKPDLAGDPIIVHPDVRRMLMTQRAWVEGGRALAFWVSVNLDLGERHPDADERSKYERKVSLLTPVVKSFLSDKAFECTDVALQCFGGHGYIRENAAEQYLRDVRMLRLGEGTSGIQAIDFIGRKVVADDGVTLSLYLDEISESVAALEDADLSDLARELREAIDTVQDVIRQELPAWKADAERMGAVSLDFLNLVGYLSVGFMWANSALAASEMLADSETSVTFSQNKLRTARFYFSYLMPDILGLVQKIRAGASTTMAIPVAEFV